MELNVHFPLYLCLLQLGSGTLAAVWYSLRSQDEFLPPLRNVTRGGWLRLGLALLPTAAALVFGLQAVLHFQNLPTLMMLTVSEPFSD